MRYYGLISPRHTFVAIGLALVVSMLLHIGVIVDFMEREGTLLSDLRNKQAAAQTAAFRLFIADNVKRVELEAR